MSATAVRTHGVPLKVTRSPCERVDGRGTTRVSVSGELDFATAPHFDFILRRAQADAALVVLDLRALTFIASCGGNLVLEAEHRARRCGGRLVVARGPAPVQRLFELMGLDSEIEFVDDLPSRLPIPRFWRRPVPGAPLPLPTLPAA